MRLRIGLGLTYRRADAAVAAGTLTSDDAGTDIYYTDDAETEPLVTQDA